jgi:hypothetical protein
MPLQAILSMADSSYGLQSCRQNPKRLLNLSGHHFPSKSKN